LWYVRCCSIRANHLSRPWHLSFSMMTTSLAWKQDKQVVISSVGGSCWYVFWREVHEVMMQSQWWVGRLGIQIEIRDFCKKNWIYDCRVNSALSMMRCQTISQKVWCIHLNGICWNAYPNTMQILETCQREAMSRTISLSQHKMHCSSKQQQHVSQWYPTSISIWYLSDCIAECHWTGGKVGCEIGKAFVWEKLSKKVQFLQPNNDDMMKKVYAMARKYMNYDANDFSSL
jgi:hypothetical protein